MDVFFFWLFAAGMIGFSLAVVLGRNPVASALCFAISMIFMAALFVMLHAFFLAAVQILVTAGAVMVLFLFIIMLLDIGAMAHAPRQRIWAGVTLLLALGFVYVLARVLVVVPAGGTTANSVKEHVVLVSGRTGTHRSHIPMDDTHQIGRLLFTMNSPYLAPFEVTSLLILVATIGVVVLCKEARPVRRKTADEVDADPNPRTGPALTR
jgi:NADH-quinone oxidoreductase subunit J